MNNVSIRSFIRVFCILRTTERWVEVGRRVIDIFGSRVIYPPYHCYNPLRVFRFRETIGVRQGAFLSKY